MQSRNKIVLACAGSGKTWGICNDVLSIENHSKKILMLSYTHKGVESLKIEYAKQDKGVIDDNVRIYTWFQFLMRELIKPYQSCYLKGINKIRSCDFSKMYGVDYSRKNTEKYFLSGNNDVKANHASEFALYLNHISNGAVLNRLEEVYSCIYIDELQDLVGRDIDLLELLFLSSIRIYCVGDYKQATLKTHNAKANKGKSGVHVFEYLETLGKTHNLDVVKDNHSRRFVQDIADFANVMYPSDPITSVVKSEEEFMGVYQILNDDLSDYINYFHPNILRYDKNTVTQGYQALNFGVSKGVTMNRVLIFPNGPLTKFLRNLSNKLNAVDKYYVGATRARYSLAFVVDKLEPNDYFVEDTINIGNRKLKVTRFKIVKI